MSFPHHRPRRLRSTAAIRDLVSERRLARRDLVLPLFVREGITAPVPVESMPGVVQHTMESLRAAAATAVDLGVGGLMLFGVPSARDECGRAGAAADGILNQALQVLREDLGDATVLMADCCIDEFTSHGHCGVLNDRGQVDNDATLAKYTQVAIAQASAGAHLVGLSGMMDGQVAAVRQGLDSAGFVDTLVLAYSAKYASASYGPFRDAVDSQLEGDRRTYQQDPANRRESWREVDLDIREGADVVMVKPAGGFLDIVRDVADRSVVPVWAYQVSGEYSMIEAAAANGWIDRDSAVLESLVNIKRAGADTIFTYWAADPIPGLLA